VTQDSDIKAHPFTVKLDIMLPTFPAMAYHSIGFGCTS